MNKIDEYLKRDDAFQISFSTSILPGRARCASFMTKGSGKWVKGYGETVDEAFADLIRQIDGPTKKMPGM